MVACELCGKEVDRPIKVEVAGTKMNACTSCRKMGKVLGPSVDSANSNHTFYKKKKELVEKEVISNATSIVNSNLAKKGLNVQQLARILNIKESTLNKILSGKLILDLIVARKLENYFEINLTQDAENSNINPQDYMASSQETVEPSSLGDLLLQKLKEKK